MSIRRCSIFDRLARLWRAPRVVLPALFCALLGPVSLVNAQELTVNEQYDAAFLEMIVMASSSFHRTTDQKIT
jgi:hypothetical protein|tara:strand:+ start:110 stop:328 length:219 start_codon:yes stop_codon:yes gene_type:complete